MSGQGWWFKPFLGGHHVSQTFYSGMNGFMGGWILGYFFKIKNISFLFTDWHEIEFERSKGYANGNGGKTQSLNGAAAVWWLTHPKHTLGIQWRYATNKLGTAGSLQAYILTYKFNL